MNAKILAVDNDANILRLLDVKLKKAGYETITAADGEEGERIAREEKPDVVISGIRIPKLDGLALTRQLKADTNPAPLVILLTAVGDDATIAAGFEAGADDYLTKPFSPLVLLERIRVNLIRAGRIAPEAESEAADA